MMKIIEETISGLAVGASETILLYTGAKINTISSMQIAAGSLNKTTDVLDIVVTSKEVVVDDKDYLASYAGEASDSGPQTNYLLVKKNIEVETVDEDDNRNIYVTITNDAGNTGVTDVFLRLWVDTKGLGE